MWNRATVQHKNQKACAERCRLSPPFSSLPCGSRFSMSCRAQSSTHVSHDSVCLLRRGTKGRKLCFTASHGLVQRPGAASGDYDKHRDSGNKKCRREPEARGSVAEGETSLHWRSGGLLCLPPPWRVQSCSANRARESPRRFCYSVMVSPSSSAHAVVVKYAVQMMSATAMKQ